MELPDAESPTPAGSCPTRWPELGVAAFLFAIGAVVVADALRVGIGWAEDGPRSGYFPFGIGVALLASSAYVLVATLIRWQEADSTFAERGQLANVFAVLLPTAAYVAGVWLLGIYVASFALIGWFMRRHGRLGWLLTVAVSAGVPLAVFLVFERWFLVSLPKGPLENWLGL